MELKSASHTKDLTIHATDGEIGNIDDFYFDDETWTIRYLIVTTGNWLSQRPVLISPMFVARADWDAKQLHLSLTKEQIENSPDIDTRKPVSRQEEAAYQIAFGRSYYWGGSDLWGFGAYPMDLAVRMPEEAGPPLAANESPDSHLRSINEVQGYHVLAADGTVGHVEDFILDQATWSIRYLEVDTRNWWPGKTVLLAPDWVEKVSWVDSQVAVAVSKETIQTSPEYMESKPITRAYEARLHEHYGHSPYWMWEAGRPPLRRPRQDSSV